MPVDPVGAQPQSSAVASRLNQSSIDPQEFLRLFLTGLHYQDPMNPPSNEQFLAQMAQFASLEQSQRTNASLENLVLMNSAAQSVSLLGRSVEVSGVSGAVLGTVKAVQFTSSGPLLTVDAGSNNVLTDVRLSQVRLVRQ